MPNIFNYLDYRKFLLDFYTEKKEANRYFSFQLFASLSGFHSKSFIKMVIDGKKRLSGKSMEKINNALKLKEKQYAYFKDLVAFNQAPSLQLRDFYFERLLSYNKRNAGRMLIRQQYDFFSQWYYSAVREIAAAVDFKEDYTRLGRLVKPAISQHKARQSVKTLLSLGMLRKNSNGRYTQVVPVLSTGDEIRSLAVQNFHLKNIYLAGQSIDTVQSSERDISCIIAGISNEKFAEIKKEIQLFRKKILQLIESETKVDRVYHINFQLFPTSEYLHENR